MKYMKLSSCAEDPDWPPSVNVTEEPNRCLAFRIFRKVLLQACSNSRDTCPLSCIPSKLTGVTCHSSTGGISRDDGKLQFVAGAILGFSRLSSMCTYFLSRQGPPLECLSYTYAGTDAAPRKTGGRGMAPSISLHRYLCTPYIRSSKRCRDSQ